MPKHASAAKHVHALLNTRSNETIVCDDWREDRIDDKTVFIIKRNDECCDKGMAAHRLNTLATEAAWLNGTTHGKKKAKVCLDINRPSHGRLCLLFLIF